MSDTSQTTRRDSALRRYAPRIATPAILLGVLVILASRPLSLGRVTHVGSPRADGSETT